MANTSRINGFRVVKHANGSAYNGQANLYYVSSATDEILVGDVVKLAGSADTNGIASVDIAGINDMPVGVVTAVVNPKIDVSGKMTNGGITLDLPQSAQIAATTAGYVLVADSPDVIMEVEAGTGGTALAAVDVGLNVKMAVGARTSATVTSPAVIDTAVAPAVTATFMFQLLGFAQKINNEIGASAKVLVRFNQHQYQSVGNVGL